MEICQWEVTDFLEISTFQILTKYGLSSCKQSPLISYRHGLSVLGGPLWEVQLYFHFLHATETRISLDCKIGHLAC